MRVPLLRPGVVAFVFVASMAIGQEARTPGVLAIAGEQAVIARQSKSPDGKYALTWTLKEKETADWALLESDPGAFYNEHDAAEVWVVDLPQSRKLDTLVGKTGYIRPGTHRSLAAAWGAEDESGRRFALGAYDWKWGTDTIYLIDVGPQETRHLAIGPQLDQAIATFLKRTSPEAKAALNITYAVAGLPEHGTKTGFTDPSTILLPFSVKVSPEDRLIAECVMTLKLQRLGSAPSVTVVKITRGAAAPEVFADNAQLAKADAELNAVYATLLKRANAAQKSRIREEQREWIAKRDKQAAETPADAGENARIVRDRALTALTQKRTAELRATLSGAGR